MKKALFALTALAASTTSALAVPGGIVTRVPEISAVEGVAAVAAVAAVLFAVWERKRRAA